MASSDEEDNVTVITLPPVIRANKHSRVLAEEIPAIELVTSYEKPKEVDILEPSAPLKEPIPKHPLHLAWSPDELIFELDENPVVQRIWVWNRCARPVYLHCCDVRGESAYLGARWLCYPKTRFFLAPGIKTEMYIRASPREAAPVPGASASLQLAAAHRWDIVVGYFAVPIDVKFMKYVPYLGNGE